MFQQPAVLHKQLKVTSRTSRQFVLGLPPCNMLAAGATLLSFVVALVHFVTELLVFRTMSVKGAAPPMVIAGECSNAVAESVDAASNNPAMSGGKPALKPWNSN